MKLEVVIKQDEIDYDGDSDDVASLASVDMFSTATPSTVAVRATAAASAGRSKSQPNKSKAKKKKPPANNTDMDANQKESQQLPVSWSRICDTCGKELSNADGIELHLKIHANEGDYECKTCWKRFIHKKNLVVSIVAKLCKMLSINAEIVIQIRY